MEVSGWFWYIVTSPGKRFGEVVGNCEGVEDGLLVANNVVLGTLLIAEGAWYF